MNLKRLFWILFLLNLLNYVDRQVLYAVFPLLQADLQLTDLQLGALASAFMLMYMCYAPVMGYLADRISRPRLIALSAWVWSGATLACGLAKNYISLFVARTLIGAGEGGFTTIAQPFLAENYPKEKHASLLALFGLALPVGSALGYMLGGVVGQHMGWRLAFVLAGVPGVFLGLLAGVYLKDKAREKQTRGPSFSEYKPLLCNKPFLYICFAQAMSTFVMGGMSAWMPMYLHRYAAFTVAQAGGYFGILVVICGAIGTYGGGKLAVALFPRTPRAYSRVIAGAFACALPFCGLTLAATQPGVMLTFLALVLVLLFIPTGAIAAALVATTDEKIRSMAFALNIFLIHLLGDAFSPTFVGWMSDAFSLKAAVLLASLMLVPGAFAAWRARV